MDIEQRMERAVRIILDISSDENIPLSAYDDNILGEERSINDVMEEYKKYGEGASRYLIKNEPYSEMKYVCSQFQDIWIFGSSAEVMATLISQTSSFTLQVLTPYKIFIYDLDSNNYMKPMDIKISAEIEWNGEKFTIDNS